MEKVEVVIPAIKVEMTTMLQELVAKAIEEASVAMRNQTATAMDSKTLFDARAKLLENFGAYLAVNFDRLLGQGSQAEVNVLDYGNLSLVEEADLEAIIALEGMIAHARNCDISEYLAFSTRLNELCFGVHIDESNNPMDPEQIGDAFKDAVKPLGMAPKSLLLIYRHFNTGVFHQLETVLSRANEIMVEHGIMADLDMAARAKKDIQNRRGAPRERTDPTERAFQGGSAQGGSGPGESDNPSDQAAMSRQMFAMMQSLLHGAGAQAGAAAAPASGTAAGSPANPAAMPPGHAGHVMPNLQPGMMIGSQKVELVATEQLLDLIARLDAAPAGSAGGALADGQGKGKARSAPLDLSESLGKLLASDGDQDTFRAVDNQSADVINLITMLYEAIWDDGTVPIPIKELIGRTQITALKIALHDANFFDRDDHPARQLINELATAGIIWTESDKLDKDPMYRKMFEIVERMVDDYQQDTAYLDELLANFRQFKQAHMQGGQEIEARLKDADARAERLDEVKRYAHQRIRERILDERTPAVVLEFLDNQFHRFLVEVILREGPGGNSWRPIINTIDVLLWTVQRDKTEADRQRFKKVNGRLLTNLARSMDVAGVEKAEADAILKRIQSAQRSILEQSAEEPVAPEPADDSFEAWMQSAATEAQKYEADLPDDDEHLQEVNRLPLGIWMEFDVDGQHTIRCTLAAKIASIDKYVFVNGQGVKVVEKSRIGLARELKAGTVRIISESPLLDRAMEIVIGRLRSGQQEAEPAANP